MVAVPNPVIASVQIIDPGYDVNRVEILGSGIVHQGRTMGYGRCKIVDADNPGRVIAFNEGQGRSSAFRRKAWAGWTFRARNW